MENSKSENAKWLELYDGCVILVHTDAETVEEFLATVPTRCDPENGIKFFYGDAWYLGFDLDFIPEPVFYD